MTITNGYCTLSELKEAVGIDVEDVTDDVTLEDAIEAASRQWDAFAGQGRKFFQDASAVARYYYPSEALVLRVDDISTSTGLIVKVDEDDDGTYETTLTINTDFKLEPVNAAAEYPVQPWTRIRLLTDGTLATWERLASGRPYVEVTAKFGWPAVPEPVKRATLLQAKSLFKAPDTQFGTFNFGLDGTPLRVPALDPIGVAMMHPFRRYDEVDDGTSYA